MNFFTTLADIDVSSRRRVYHNGTCWMMGSPIDEPFASRHTAAMDERAFEPVNNAQILKDCGTELLTLERAPFTTIEQLLADDVYELQEQFHNFILNMLKEFGQLSGAQYRELVQNSKIGQTFMERWGRSEMATFYLSRAAAKAWNDLAEAHAV